MDFDQFVTSITQDGYIPKVIDTVLGGNVLTLRLMSNPSRWNGHEVKIPVKTESSTSGGAFGPYDTFDTTRRNTRQTMSFGPRAYYQSVSLSNIEQAVNQGEAQVLNLVQTELESASQDMIDGLGDQMYGTGSGANDITGLRAAIDDGTNAANYGGLSRSTYTTLQSYVDDSVGNLTLSAMGTAFNEAAAGNDTPTLIITTETIWQYYESLLQPTTQANYDAMGSSLVTRNSVVSPRDGLQGQAGFRALLYRGVPIVSDEKCPAQHMFFINEKYLNWYSLEHPRNQMMSAAGGNIDGVYSDTSVPTLSWTGWKQPVNQDVVTGQMIAYGELINKNPVRSARLAGITGV